jgi:hypothetical protein
MGFLDKAKEAAEKAMAATQQAAQQGQAKIGEMQAAKSDGDLLKALGEAYYDEQRSGGGHDAVEAALAAVDEHRAAATKAATDAPPAGGGDPAASTGNFTLDDV